MMTLYIEGVKLDTPQNFFFTMTYRSSWFTSIDKITLSYSGTISIPKTANNTAALGAIISPSSVSDAPYKYLNADVMQDGIMFLKGAQVYLQQVTDDGYKLSLVWGDMNALKRMKDDEKELTALTTTKPDFNWTIVDTKNFPRVIDSHHALLNFDGTDVTYAFQRFPSVSCKSLIAKICAHYDMYEPPAEDTESIKDWVIPLMNRIDPIITEGEKYYDINEWTTHFILGDMNGEGYDIKMSKGGSNPDEYPPQDTENTPGGFNYLQEGVFVVSRELRAIGKPANSVNTLDSLVPLYSNIKILTRGEMKAVVSGVYNYESDVKLQLVYKHRKIGAGSYTEEDILTISPKYYEESGFMGATAVCEWDEESDTIPLVTQSRMDIYKDLDARLVWRLATSNLYVTIVSSNVVISSQMEYVVVGSPYYNFANYPKMKMLDCIKNISILAGKFVYIENVEMWDGLKMVAKPRLRMVSYDDAINSTDIYDWSRYADSELRDMTFTAGEWSQRNIFAYKENDNYTDSITMPIASEVLKERYEVNVPFNAVRMSSDGVMIVHKYHDEEDEYGDSYLNNEDLELLKGINIYNGNDDKMYIGKKYYNEVTKGYDVLALPWSELKANYDTVMETLQKMKVVKETMRLPQMVLRDLNLHKLVYIDKYGCYFAILQIRTRNNGTCDVELLKI